MVYLEDRTTGANLRQIFPRLMSKGEGFLHGKGTAVLFT